MFVYYKFSIKHSLFTTNLFPQVYIPTDGAGERVPLTITAFSALFVFGRVTGFYLPCVSTVRASTVNCCDNEQNYLYMVCHVRIDTPQPAVVCLLIRQRHH